MAKYVIGVDGGGTKTVGVLMDESGRIWSKEVGPSSNFQVIGAEKLGQVLSDLVKTLIVEAGLELDKPDYLYAGLAGAGRPADRQAISGVLAELDIAREFTVGTDAEAALGGAFAGGPGIILISGTGMICFGKGKDGTIVRSGGWGYLLGDEGSGYYIGQQAILAALKDLDGRGDKTSLRQRVEKEFNLPSIDLIISDIYSGKIDRTRIASLAPLVFEEAEKGDAVARQIVATAGTELGKLPAAVAKKLGIEDEKVTVALIGSVFKQRKVLEPYMRSEALKTVKEIEFIEPRFEPAIGSTILALQAEGVAITPELLKAIEISSKETL